MFRCLFAIRRSDLRHLLVLTGFTLSLVANVAQAAPLELAEPASDSRVFGVVAKMHVEGKVKTAAGGGKTEEHPLNGDAKFKFRERRLPSAGRDAQALRAVRDFEVATLENQVADMKTDVALGEEQRLIVACGQREGIVSYCPTAFLERETLDLLELPGDPLALIALLPLQPVEQGAEWTPADWAGQMLATCEAVEKSSLSCKLVSVSGTQARIEITGQVIGQRLGANTDNKVQGYFIYDLQHKCIKAAELHYQVALGIGTVSPGIDAHVDITVERAPLTNPGRLTDALAAKIPLDTPADTLNLLFHAKPWRLMIKHDRNWNIFQAIMEGQPQVVILRLMDKGSLVCQCNISPVATAAPGDHVPLEQFEGDIKKSLGTRLKEISRRENVQLDEKDTRKIFRVVAEGQVELKNSKGAINTIPMVWVYYLVADKTGRQVSFVFSVESNLTEQLDGRDLEMVKNLKFTSSGP